MSDNVSPLPNPLTPMVFLPPEVAIQATNGVYVLVGACAVLVWDLMDNITNDYRLLTKYKLRLPIIVYFISRLGSLGLVLTGTLFVSSAITWDCHHFLKIAAAFYPISIPATTLLFLLRLAAVFDRNRIIIAFFVLIWTSLLASALAIPWGMTGENIGPTKYCITTNVREFMVAPTLISLFHDTLILFAISWRLMKSTHLDPDIRRGVKSMVFGDYLPSFSRALLHSGQQYYTATVSLNLLTVIIFLVPSAPIVYRLMFTVPNVAMMNIMACRVFRKTKFGLIRDSSMATSALYTSSNTGIIGGDIPLPVRLHLEAEKGSTFKTSTNLQRQSGPESSLVIQISRDIRYDTESQNGPKVYTESSSST